MTDIDLRKIEIDLLNFIDERVWDDDRRLDRTSAEKCSVIREAMARVLGYYDEVLARGIGGIQPDKS